MSVLPKTYEPTEDEILLGELSYSPMFRRFLELLIFPRLQELRLKLLHGDASQQELGEFWGAQKWLEKVYETSEAGVPPGFVQNIFR